VLDRYEQGATHNTDLFDHHDQADWIVAISTLEHVRWDEPDTGRLADGPQRALEHLHHILRPGGQMLITIPMGWHPYLDSAILDGKLPVQPTRQCTLVRQGSDPMRWAQTDTVTHHRYAASSIWAESVWVAEFAA
jgi:SAM-dependent methyltransferase